MHYESNPQFDATTVPQHSSVIDVKKKPAHRKAFTFFRCQKWFIQGSEGQQFVTTVAVVSALFCVVLVEGFIFAAAPRGRFVDRFLRAPEPTPQLISVPTPRPPTVAEKQAGKKKLAATPTKDSKNPSVSKIKFTLSDKIEVAK